MYKTILFDFDGTVFDTGEGVMKCVQYAARAFGFQADDMRQLRRFVGPPLLETLKKQYGVDDETARAMLAKYRERYSDTGVNECSPYPGVAELASELRASGLKVAVATGKPTVYTKQILAAHGMENTFDEVLGSEFDGTRSQKWEVIAELLKTFGAEGAVMVGDRDNDVIGAKKCGLPCIGVAWGFAEPGELKNAGAICVVENTEELKNILLG
ncbi:MAG: HAD hydrolase-like protein [Oscillospiraceae bacterium]